VIGPLDDLIAAAVGANPNKVRAIIVGTAFVLCIVVIGLRLFATS
jgi:hypothetical protein